MVPEFLAIPLTRPVIIAFSHRPGDRLPRHPSPDRESPLALAPRGTLTLSEPTRGRCDRSSGTRICGRGQPRRSGPRPRRCREPRPRRERVPCPAAEGLLFGADLAARLSAVGDPMSASGSPHATPAGRRRSHWHSRQHHPRPRPRSRVPVRSVPSLPLAAGRRRGRRRPGAVAGRPTAAGRPLQVSHRERPRSRQRCRRPNSRRFADLIERLSGQAALTSVSYGTEGRAVSTRRNPPRSSAGPGR